MEERFKRLIKLWTIVAFAMFFYQSLLIFTTIYLNSYPTGSVIIYTNKSGELIYEIIISGLIVVISFICLVFSIILSFKKNGDKKT